MKKPSPTGNVRIGPENMVRHNNIVIYVQQVPHNKYTHQPVTL